MAGTAISTTGRRARSATSSGCGWRPTSWPTRTSPSASGSAAPTATGRPRAGPRASSWSSPYPLVSMGYEIEVIEAPEQPTAVVSLSTTWPELPAQAGEAFDEVWAFLRREEGLRFDGHNVILYRDGQPHVEVGVIVTGSFEPEGRVQ